MRKKIKKKREKKEKTCASNSFFFAAYVSLGLFKISFFFETVVKYRLSLTQQHVRWKRREEGGILSRGKELHISTQFELPHRIFDTFTLLNDKKFVGGLLLRALNS